MPFNVGKLILSNYVAVSINKMFWPWRPSSAAYKTACKTVYKTVLYAADKGLHGQNILQSVFDRYCYVIAPDQFAYTLTEDQAVLRTIVMEL